jgi:hypothetical protein
MAKKRLHAEAETESEIKEREIPGVQTALRLIYIIKEIYPPTSRLRIT